MMPTADRVIHASCVSLRGRGALILGPSGSGKSSLALQLMASGASLVADDRVLLSVEGGRLIASAPPGLPSLIEARGVGLLHADLVFPVQVVLAVDLGQVEAERLPPLRHTMLQDVVIDIVHGPVSDHLGYAIRQYLVAGRGA